MAATTTNDSESSNLYDHNPSSSSSTQTQPLLSSSPDPYPDSSDQTQFLQISYKNAPNRPFKDIPFLILFTLFSLLAFAFGFFSIANKNNNYDSISSYYYNSTSSSCAKNSTSSITDGGGVGDDPLGFGFARDVDDDRNLGLLLFLGSGHFVKGLVWALVVTVLLSGPIVWGLLLLLKRYSKQVVYVAVPLAIGIMVGVNVYWFVACTVRDTCCEVFPLGYRVLVLVFVFVVIGIVVWVLVVSWDRVELTTRVMGVGADALSRNLGLFGVLPVLAVGLVVYYVPIVVFLVFARMNGKIVAKEESGEYYCVWKRDSWVPAYYALAILTMLWTAAVALETKAYVITGTVAQWYFSKDDETARRRIRSSLRNAFGPSFGTVCFSGLLICVVWIIRATVDCARREDIPGFFNAVLRCFVNTFLSAIDFLNKFTINFAAITGEAFCTSARMTYELLKRNLLSAVFVETISSRLLIGIILVVSSIYAVAVCAITNAASDLGIYSYYVGLSTLLLLLVVLGFFAHVLNSVIDTVYVCYAIDRDRGDVSKPDVHEVYVNLPISRSQRSSLISRAPLNV
ncbi:hypothetical protein Droror1_Dr00001273 [Drosera rotundifolia]